MARSLRSRLADAARAFSRGPATAPVAQRNFKGAEQSRLTSDWLAALLSPNDEIRGDLRILRARARELARNNAYAGQFLELVTTNVIGPHGPRLRAKSRGSAEDLDSRVNDEIEARWLEYFNGPVTTDGTMSGVEAQELALETTAKEGEAFVRRVHGRDFRHGLGIQFIDPDLVDDSYTMQGARQSSDVYMGVEVDSFGRRLGYHVLDYPYGPGYAGRGRVRVPASEVLHTFRAKRANQMRGVTWMARAMDPLKSGERYEQNELVASAAGAAKMGFITNDAGGMGAVTTDVVTEGAAAGAGDTASSGGARVTLEAEPGSIWELDPGQKFEGWSPDHPSTAYAGFMSAVLRKAASGLGVSYEALSSDLSQVTYLSARAGLLIERMTWSKLQQWWIRVFLQPWFEWWLESAYLSGELDLPGGDWRLYRNVLWTPRGWDWVDPSKDAEAAGKMLELKLTTRSRILAERGADFEDILEELKRENELAAQYGIDLTPAKAALPAQPPKPSGDGTDGSGPDGEDGDAPAQPSRNGKRHTSRVAAR